MNKKTIEIDKFDLEKYRKNPVILKSHNYKTYKPLGKVMNYNFSKPIWEITIKPNKGKEKIIKEISQSQFLAETRIKIKLWKETQTK